MYDQMQGGGQANLSPWATMIPPGEEKAWQLDSFRPSEPAKAPPPKKTSPWAILNPMRAIEKDPLLAAVAGKKWTPVDEQLSGGK